MIHTKGNGSIWGFPVILLFVNAYLIPSLLSAYAKMHPDLRSRAYLQVLKKYVVFTDICLGTLLASHCRFALDLQIFDKNVVYLNLQISIQKSRNSRQSCICNKIAQLALLAHWYNICHPGVRAAIISRSKVPPFSSHDDNKMRHFPVDILSWRV